MHSLCSFHGFIRSLFLLFFLYSFVLFAILPPLQPSQVRRLVEQLTAEWPTPHCAQLLVCHLSTHLFIKLFSSLIFFYFSPPLSFILLSYTHLSFFFLLFNAKYFSLFYIFSSFPRYSNY
jgi:hypothetical protein